MRQTGRRQPEAAAEPAGGVGSFVVERRSGLGVLAVAIAAIVAGGFAWQRFGPDVRQQPEFLLRPENVILTGQPDWVNVDIAAEALRDASLDASLPLDDPELARRLARAFDVHPWVRSVDRVEVKSPAAAFVTITCREPVAMVRVPGGLLPVDGEGVVLPSDGFTPEEAASYPVVAGVSSLPQGPAGSAWGDPVVEQAVAVVAVTFPEWTPLDLVECRLVKAGQHGSWELVNASGMAIAFGSAPGQERRDEQGMAEKIAALKQLATAGPISEPVDLRNASAHREAAAAPLNAAEAPADSATAEEPGLTLP